MTQYIGHARRNWEARFFPVGQPWKNIESRLSWPGYRTFETEVDLLRGQKSEVKTELVKGSIEQAGSGYEIALSSCPSSSYFEFWPQPTPRQEHSSGEWGRRQNLALPIHLQ